MSLTQHLNQGSLLYLDQHHEKLSVEQNSHYRWLTFEQVIQSVMHRRCPEKLTLPHHIALMLPLIFFKPEQVLEFGLGGGNIARYMLGLNANIVFTSIERSPRVIDAFESFFNPDEVKINIISDEDIRQINQLQKKPKQWLIYDIYRAENDTINDSDKQLLKLSKQLAKTSCLSINLVDISDEHFTLLLRDLCNNLPQHHLTFFKVPHYRNIIVHLLPNSFTENIDDTASYLPKRLLKKWQRIWSLGEVVKGN